MRFSLHHIAPPTHNPATMVGDSADMGYLHIQARDPISLIDTFPRATRSAPIIECCDRPSNIKMPLQQAKVKSVLSGDTLVLHSVHNVHQERILSLAFVSAPRLRREGDEVSAPLHTFRMRTTPILAEVRQSI